MGPLLRQGEYSKQGRLVIAARYYCDGRRYHAEVWTYRNHTGEYVLMFPLWTRTIWRQQAQEVLVELRIDNLLLDVSGECPASAQTASVTAYRLTHFYRNPDAPLFQLELEGNPPHAALKAVRFDLFGVPPNAFVDAPIAQQRLANVSAQGPSHPYWRP